MYLLMSIVGKVYICILLTRLEPFIDPLLDHSQNGFRRCRGATGHILALRRIIEEYQRHSKQEILTFLDFKKTFDSINRSRMKKILKLYGIPDKVIEQIHCMYLGSRSQVRVDRIFRSSVFSRSFSENFNLNYLLKQSNVLDLE